MCTKFTTHRINPSYLKFTRECILCLFALIWMHGALHLRHIPNQEAVLSGFQSAEQLPKERSVVDDYLTLRSSISDSLS